jgi:hypothetical protein
MRKDLVHDIKVAQCVVAQTLTATTTGTAVDMSGYEAATFIINVGTGVSTDNKLTVSLVEGAASDSLTDVAAADQLNASFDITAVGVYKIGYRGVKRYVAVKLTETGTVSAPVSVTGVLSSARVAPIA